jgi:hypothetical protein
MDGDWGKEQLDGIADRHGDVRRGEDLLAPRERGRDENSSCAGSRTRCDVAADVPNDCASRDVDTRTPGRGVNHPRLWLAARAPSLGEVGTHHDDVELAQQLSYTTIHGDGLAPSDESTTDSALVGDDPHLHFVGAESGERLSSPVHRHHSPRFAVVGNVDDESPVAIEQNQLGRVG